MFRSDPFSEDHGGPRCKVYLLSEEKDAEEELLPLRRVSALGVRKVVVFGSQEPAKALWAISDWFVAHMEIHQVCIRTWMLWQRL